MDYELEIDRDAGFVTARLAGVRRPDSLIEAAAEITADCRDRGIFRVLIDVREMTGQLDTLETFDVAGRGIPNRTEARRLIRSAILDRTENIQRIRFFETVAVNRGLTVKVFDDETDAVRWLLEDLNAPPR
jgi:hypothetical protein